MTRFLKFIGRRPLAISILAFVIGFVAFGNSFSKYGPSYYEPSFYVQATVLCLVSLSVCALAVINLIRAERRGYSSQRCQLSVVFLFFAFAGSLFLCSRVIGYYLRR